MIRGLRALGALAVGLAVILAGCGRHTDDRRTPVANLGDQVTINMMDLWPESGAPAQYRIVNQVIEEYEDAHPNVTIKREVLENERYKAKIKVLSAVNELPDVGMTWPAGYIQPFARSKLFTPLDELLRGEWKDSFVAGSTEAYAVDGRTYALPLEFNLAPVYYNKEIFAQYGLRPPATYDEFLRVVNTLASHGVEPIVLGNKDRWTGSLWYMYLADRIAGAQTLENAIRGEASFTDPGLVEAARRVQELVKRNAFNQGFNGLSNDEVKADFVRGRYAMYLMGTWELPNYTTNQGIPQSQRDNIGFFKFPSVRGGEGDTDRWVGGPGVGLFVAENSPVKLEAKKFVQYFVKRWGEEAVTGAGVIPATKVDTAKDHLPRLYVDLINELNAAKRFTLFADVLLPSGAAEVHLNQIQALFGEEIEPEAFAAAHDAAIRLGK